MLSPEIFGNVVSKSGTLDFHLIVNSKYIFNKKKTIMSQTSFPNLMQKTTRKTI